jgi:hypothetical protein
MDYGKDKDFENCQWTTLRLYGLKVFVIDVQKSWKARAPSSSGKYSLHSVQNKMGKSISISLMILGYINQKEY